MATAVAAVPSFQAPSGSREWTIGSNRMVFEDGILVLHSRELGSPEGFRETVRIFEELSKEGPYYLVCDMTGLKAAFPKHLGGEIQKVKLSWFRKSVLVGMNRPMKLATKAVIVGLCLVGQPAVTAFADTVEQAKDLIRKDRESQPTA